MALQLETAGWDVTTVRAGDVAPEPPELGKPGRFGLVFTVPGSEEHAIRRVIEKAEIKEYALHRRVLDSTAFTVIELRAPTSRQALFVAGAVDTSNVAALAAAATERGEMYTHVRLLDGTTLGSVRHDEAAAFFGTTG